MGFGIQTIQHLLTQASTIQMQCDKIAELTGENFNIFKILKFETKEVRLHTTLLAELLNTNGQHGQKDKFLVCFIAIIQEVMGSENKVNFITKNATITAPKHIGPINKDYTQGGTIDIVITDINKNRILIEVKINAPDQKNQIIRYKNFDKNAVLLYLTLDGKEPTVGSKGTDLQSGRDYFNISYKKVITDWLSICLKESSRHPVVRETLYQYFLLIKHLTNSPNYNEMTEEIKSILLQNRDHFKSVDSITNSYTQLKEQIKNKFYTELNNIKPEALIGEYKEYKLFYCMEEDSDAFYFGFYLKKGDDSVDATNTIFKPLRDSFILLNKYFKNTKPYIGWIGSEHVGKFYQLDLDTIYNLSKDEFRRNFIDKILNELNQYILDIKNQLKFLNTL